VRGTSWVVVVAAGCCPPAELPVVAPAPGAAVEQAPAVAPAEAVLAAAPPAVAGGEAWTVETDPSGGFDYPSAIAVAGDAVYVTGYEGVGGSWRVERRRAADGALVWEHDARPTYWGVRDLAVSGDDVFLAGDDRIEKRAAADGALVAAFGAGGQVQVGTRGKDIVDERIHAIAVAADTLFVVGESEGGLWIQKRDRITGALVPGFAIGGMWRHDPSAGPHGRSLGSNYLLTTALAGDGLISGGFQAAGGELGRVQRLRTGDGAFDPRFGTGGALAVGKPGHVGTVSSLAVHDGGIHLLFEDWVRGGNSHWLVERRAASDGAVVWSTTLDPSLGPDTAGGLAADARGVVVVGAVGTARWVIYEVGLDGRAGPAIERDPGPDRDEATAVAIDAAWIYVAGFSSATRQDTRWRIERIARGAGPGAAIAR
jgi:hypothetical protein